MATSCTAPWTCSSGRRSSRRWTPRSRVPARATARWSPSRARAGSARRGCWPPPAAPRARPGCARCTRARPSSNARSRSASCASSSSPRCSRPTADERDRWLSGAAGLTRSMFEDAGAGHDESSYARLHGLYWLCANLAADAPLLVCVDDAQWSDEPSLSFLGFLARRLEDLPVALVLGTRPRAEQESEVLRGLVTDPGTRLLRPPALTGARRRPVGARGGRSVGGRRLLRRLPRDDGRQPVPDARAAARGARQAAARDRRRGRDRARARARRRSRPSCCSG